MIRQSRADNSTACCAACSPNPADLDDFGLKRLNVQRSSDFYEVIIERHRRASTMGTSNHALQNRIPSVDDPILAPSP